MQITRGGRSLRGKVSRRSRRACAKDPWANPNSMKRVEKAARALSGVSAALCPRGVQWMGYKL